MDAVIVNRGQGGLGRQPLGQDFISGLIFYGSLPSGWSSGAVKKFGGVQDAINAGITPAHLGETAAILETAVTEGDTGDTVNIYFQEPNGTKVLLVSYVQQAGDTTATLFATHCAAAITANSHNNGGYTATGSTGNILITLRPGLGIYANTNYATLMTFTYPVNVSTTLALGAASLSTSGVASQIDNYYYHISRFFTQSPNATLYVSVTTAPSWSGYAFGEIGIMQTAATGSIRQMGIFIPTTFATAFVTACQAQAALLVTANIPASIIIGADFSATTAAALTDLSGLNSEHVSVSVGQDGANIGFGLFNAYGKSITQVGDILGLCSFAQVSDDIGWVATYNLAIDGLENAIPAFATGQLLSSQTSGTVNAVDAYRYIFGTNAPNNSPSGTFVNDSHCATLYTSDYAYIENNRTFDKAQRQTFSAYYVQLKAPLTVNADGTLTNAQVSFFEGIGEQALSNMIANNPNSGRPELSAFSVVINPAQNVLSTSQLVVAIQIQPVGVARNIIINLSFTVSVA